MVGGDDGRIEEDGEELDKHVDVEEEDNFLASDGSILGPNVEEHNERHAQRGNVDKACRCARSALACSGRQTWLEDDLAPELHVTSVACRFDASLAQHGADNERCTLTDPVERPKLEGRHLQSHVGRGGEGRKK